LLEIVINRVIRFTQVEIEQVLENIGIEKYADHFTSFRLMGVEAGFVKVIGALGQ
jgi:hypothetical protein